MSSISNIRIFCDFTPEVEIYPRIKPIIITEITVVFILYKPYIFYFDHECILKKIEMFFLEYIKYSDSSKERTNERETWQ